MVHQPKACPYCRKFVQSQASLVTKQDETTFKILNNIKAKSITCHAHQLQIAEQVKVKKLVNHATLPKRATDGSIGFDIASTQEIVVPKGTTQKIPTGIAMEIPKGLYGRIAPRSGLALKNVHVGGGVIDNDCRGNVAVILYNNSSTDLHIRIGQNIAQIIFEQAKIPCMIISDHLQ